MELELRPTFSLDASSDTGPTAEAEKSILNWLNSAYEEARFNLEQSEEVKSVEKYISYLMGKQWPAKRPAFKASPVDNRLWKILTSYVSNLTDVRPTWDITTANKAYQQQAEILKNLSEAWWLNQNVDMALGQIIIYAMLTTGYGMLKWNPELSGGLGDMELKAVGPTDLLPLRPQGLDIQSCQAVIYRTLRPLSWFRKKYGNVGWRVKPDPTYSMNSNTSSRPSWVMAGAWDLMSPGMKRIISAKPDPVQSVFPMAEYRECWTKDESVNDTGKTVYMGTPTLKNAMYAVPPGLPLYPRGRLLITGGNDVLLHDNANPFWHGRFPFEKLCMNNVPWQWHGPSEFRVQIPLQDTVNQVFAGVLDVVKKAVNPVMISPEMALSASVKATMDQSMPGAQIFYNPNLSGGGRPELIPPPTLPGYVMDLMVWAMREMDTASGLLDLNAVSRMGQIPAADTLEQLKEGQQTVIRLKGRNIEEFLRNIGTQAISNFFQFYTMERRIRLLGEDGISFQDLDFDPRNMIPAGKDPQLFAQSFAFQVKPGSSLSSARSNRVLAMNALRKQGDMDRNSLLEAAGFGPMIDKITKNLQDEGKDILINLVKSKMGGKQGGAVDNAQVLSALQGGQPGAGQGPTGGAAQGVPQQ